MIANLATIITNVCSVSLIISRYHSDQGIIVIYFPGLAEIYR